MRRSRFCSVAKANPAEYSAGSLPCISVRRGRLFAAYHARKRRGGPRMVDGGDSQTVCFHSHPFGRTIERRTAPRKIGNSTAPHHIDSMSSDSTHRVSRLLNCGLTSSYRHVRHLPTDLVTTSSKPYADNSQVERAQRCNRLLTVRGSHAAMFS